MDSTDNPPSETATQSMAETVLSLPEMARLWRDIPWKARKSLLIASGKQWFELWQSGIALDEIPAAAWGWRLQHAHAPLSLPSGLLSRQPGRMSQSRLTLAFSLWLTDGLIAWTERERFHALVAFTRCGALDRAARRQFARRIARASQIAAAERAREVYLDVLAETKRRCRQVVDCRGIWLPDESMTAEEFRHGIEAALRAPDAYVIKQSEIASVVRSHLQGEMVVIKRHRLSKPGKRLKYAWRLSRARRAWAAGVTLRRLGIATAEPLGLLEIIRGGRVTDSFIITRWLPDCRTARDVAGGAVIRAERRRAIAMWRAEWLRMIGRGMYHADTKLSNAMVQMQDGAMKLYWTDLECVMAGARMTGYRVLRNIVQMNGSLGPEFSVRDRIFFLQGLPSRFAWLRSRWCLKIIAAWTARRQRREERGTCGS
jgi:hypothetical protein